MATKKAATEVIEIRPIEIKKVTIRIVGDNCPLDIEEPEAKISNLEDEI